MAYIDQRIDAAKKAIGEAQASANEETKSSAGDKYETGRAMMQLAIEQNSTQLAKKYFLRSIPDRQVFPFSVEVWSAPINSITTSLLERDSLRLTGLSISPFHRHRRWARR